MWARVVEFMLACWLAVSPFVFQHAGDQVVLWAIDLTAAALIGGFALLSYWPPTRHLHLLTALLACALIGYGRFGAGGEPPPALQNHIVVGLLLLMFAIIPNHASRPPNSWNAQSAE